jgi:streptomycin 6-kinase
VRSRRHIIASIFVGEKKKKKLKVKLKSSRNQKKKVNTSTGAEDFATSVAARGVHRVVARAAENLVGLGAELLVDQRQAALVAQEAGFVPMAILVRQILDGQRGPSPLHHEGEIKRGKKGHH